ncbi:MAG: zinc ribbon domain-containing protein [Dehalococcoidia bacterium]
MPLYEYYCATCETGFELLRPMSQSSEDIPCPQCNNEARRIISVTAAFSKSSDGSISAVAGSGGCATCGPGGCST